MHILQTIFRVILSHLFPVYFKKNGKQKELDQNEPIISGVHFLHHYNWNKKSKSKQIQHLKATFACPEEVIFGVFLRRMQGILENLGNKKMDKLCAQS